MLLLQAGGRADANSHIARHVDALREVQRTIHSDGRRTGALLDARWPTSRSVPTVRTTLASAGLRRAASMTDSLVIIPTYNEVGNLGRLVPAILALDDFDVLVVDDASPDGTGELAEQLA